MKLHEYEALFREAIIATAQEKGIREIYIEKDYWVTFALYTLYNNEIGKSTIFKGGTALLKCYGMIERFSEDIDLVVLRKQGDTGNQLKNKIKKISRCISTVLPESQIQGITNKFGKIYKTAHSYNKSFSGYFGQIKDNIIVEATWLGHYEPYKKRSVSTFIYEIMYKHNQHEIIEECNLAPFEVLALDPKRTLCEKIMSLVRFSYTQYPIADLGNKIRHMYDIHLMLKDDNLSNFFMSNEFPEILLTVAEDDVVSFNKNNQWLKNHPSSALIFSKTDESWYELKTVYLNTFQDLVFGEVPDEKEILYTLHKIANRLRTIKWEITIA